MPLGISFWTFQALSYLFDVYREDDQAEPTLLEFSLYLAFWPTVTSGPIARLPDMLPQFRQELAFSRSDLYLGLRRIVQGAIMKFGLAEMLGAGLISGQGVSAGFDYYSGGWGGIDVWLLAFGFGFQLFFDFAGYSHMVIGAARIYGFRLPENFDRPYLSVTPSVFWTRWHMSLSFWIRDYVFLPLAAQRREQWWPYATFLVSMTLFGIWHGSKWTFVVWGVYHGVLLVLHRLGQQLKRRWIPSPAGNRPQWPAWLLTFCSISLGWIFFRANDFGQALTMLSTVFSYEAYGRLSLPASFYIVTPAVIAGYFAYHGLELLLAEWRSSYQQRPGLAGYRALAVEVAELLPQRTAWWLTPLTAMLLVLIVIVATESASRVTSFIYTTF
jgi:alginate O-acetyltransferase complex protein AlgI